MIDTSTSVSSVTFRKAAYWRETSDIHGIHPFREKYTKLAEAVEEPWISDSEAMSIILTEKGLSEGITRETRAAWKEALSYAPRTSRGRRLWAIRAKIIASGIPLLGPEEIAREVVERRGEVE